MTTKNYTLGRGELFFARAPGNEGESNDIPRGERYFGNTPDLGFAVDTEMLEHTSSDRGINEKDASVVLSVNRTGTFTCDDMKLENIALFWFGETKTVTVAAITGATDTFAETQEGLVYQIGQSDSNPAGVRGVKTVSLVGDTSTPLVDKTDYILNATDGTIEFKSGSAWTPGMKVVVTYSAEAYSFPRVVSGNSPIEGALRFRSQNPIGKQLDYYMPKVVITPNGDFALKGDSWQQVSFNIEILKRGEMEAVYVDGKPLKTSP